MVRVPLGGRRTRGYVVEVGLRDDEGLKEISAMSGELPVFDRRLLQTVNWAATHYVAPVAVLLERTAPPNLPTRPSSPAAPGDGRPPGSHPLSRVSAQAAAGRRRPVTALVGRWQDLDWLGALTPVLAAGGSVLVVTATGTEAEEVGGAARAVGLDAVVSAGDVAREVTEAWSMAQRPGSLLVGTPRVTMWRLPSLAMAVVLEEGRRAMKDRQTPTLHVRDVLATRSRIEGFSLVFFGPTPTLEVLAAGSEVVRSNRRAWPLVEVVDRREDAPGSGHLSDRAIAAIRATVAAGRRCFVFTHRRAAESAMRCVRCRHLRVCQACGSRLGREDVCRRCGREAGPCPNCGGTEFEEMASVPERLVGEIERKLGEDIAGVSPTDRQVLVGTERDLSGAGHFPLVVAVDVDGLALGHNYRSSEEALRILARLANLVEPGHGRRMMAQTSSPDGPLLTTLRRGDPIPYLEELLVERARLGLPPSSEMLAIEVRDVDDPARFDQDLRSAGADSVLGPAPNPSGWRWLIQGNLGPLRPRLRPVVQRWRDSGAAVRIDADPIDL